MEVHLHLCLLKKQIAPMLSVGCLYGLCDFLFRLVCSSCFIFEYYKKKNCFFFRYMKNTARRSKPVMMIVPFVQCFVGGFCCAIATIGGCYNWGVVAVTRSLGCWLVQWSWSRRSSYLRWRRRRKGRRMGYAAVSWRNVRCNGGRGWRRPPWPHRSRFPTNRV